MDTSPERTRIDFTQPSIARSYDYFLGGKDNFSVDREMGDQVLRVAPDGRDAAVSNRAFLRRAVRYLAGEAGIQQFIDIGSGLPTQGNVHEIAREENPATKTVYIDNDPVVVTHGRALLADNRTAIVLEGDARQGGALLDRPEIREYLDFDRPIGLLLFAILHHLKDSDDPGGITASLCAPLPSGSGLAISHFHNPGAERPEIAKRAAESERVFNETLGTGRWRTYDEIAGYFGDMAMVDPGLGPLAEWRPDPGDVPPKGNVYYTLIGGVARKA